MQPPQRRTALATMDSNTGWTSVGDPLITRSISLDAVCCSSASLSSRVRNSTLRSRPELGLLKPVRHLVKLVSDPPRS
jgi:hypothetical protein